MSAGGRTLFRNLTLQIKQGEVLACVGPSGAGKSTLLAGIAGLLPTDAGTIHFSDFDGKPELHWLFQSAPLLMPRTAIDNVAIAAEIKGITRPEALRDAEALLAELGLGGRATQPAYRLSGGEKQRVAVARAYVSRPDVILADEPTASLDPLSRSLVVAMLGRAADAGAAVVMATHDPWVASRCTRTLALDQLKL